MGDPNLNPRAGSYRRRGQLCEVLSVLAITIGAALAIHGFIIIPINSMEGIVGLLLIAIGAALFFLAVWYSARNDEELYRFSSESLFLVSSHRIATLKEVKAPEDVTSFLQTIADDSKPLPQYDLLSLLRGALGAERTREIRDIVLKYTRVDEY